MINRKYIKAGKIRINNVLHKIGYQITKKDSFYSDPIIDNDHDFIRIYNRIKKYTMTSKIQCYSLYTSIKYVIGAGIDGDFVECGVWRGGNCMLMAETLNVLGVKDKKIYLYDTFSGMTEPGNVDQAIEDTDYDAIKEWASKQEKDKNAWCYAGLEEVKQNLGQLGYPKENLIFVKGKVEDTIPATVPESVSILRLDTDWYESTTHELRHLYPRLSLHGVLIIDDYGTWAGSQKAVDEFFGQNPVLLNRIDAGNRLVIKI